METTTGLYHIIAGISGITVSVVSVAVLLVSVSVSVSDV